MKELPTVRKSIVCYDCKKRHWWREPKECEDKREDKKKEREPFNEDTFFKEKIREHNRDYSRSGYSREMLRTDCEWLANGELKTPSESKTFILYIIHKSGGKVVP